MKRKRKTKAKIQRNSFFWQSNEARYESRVNCEETLIALLLYHLKNYNFGTTAWGLYLQDIHSPEKQILLIDTSLHIIMLALDSSTDQLTAKFRY